jgi:hypothetical protein
MATKLGPFRDYSEHHVINLFALDEDITNGVTNGHCVKLSTGWKNTDELAMLGGAGASVTNTVSQRYGVAAKVKLADANDTVLGMMLYDVKETDENGEKLLFNPRKAAEMGVALSGQAIPVLTKGMLLYSGDVLKADAPTLGQNLYCDANGELTTGDGGGNIVGVALGLKDDDGQVLVRIDL